MNATQNGFSVNGNPEMLFSKPERGYFVGEGLEFNLPEWSSPLLECPESPKTSRGKEVRTSSRRLRCRFCTSLTMRCSDEPRPSCFLRTVRKDVSGRKRVCAGGHLANQLHIVRTNQSRWRSKMSAGHLAPVGEYEDMWWHSNTSLVGWGEWNRERWLSRPSVSWRCRFLHTLKRTKGIRDVAKKSNSP